MTRDRGGDVIKGTLEMIILEVLQHEPMHGWGITERIERRSHGLLSVNQGSLYPALYRLVARGWISSEWRASDNNRNARYYSLTRLGRKELAAERAHEPQDPGADRAHAVSVVSVDQLLRDLARPPPLPKLPDDVGHAGDATGLGIPLT